MTGAPFLTPTSDYESERWWAGACALCFGSLGTRRQDLYEKGVAIDLALSQVPQGVISGGAETEWEYSGLADYYLFLDSGRLGLWPGGLLGIHAQTSFGENVLSDAGTISPVNYLALLPVPGDENVTYLTEYYLYQGLTEWLVALLGRVNWANLADLTRFSGDARTQFLNTSLKVNSLLGSFVPLASTHGIALEIQPHPDVQILPILIDANDAPPTYGAVDGLFDEISVGVQLGFSWRVAGLSGSAHPVFVYTTKDTVDFDNAHLLPDLILGLETPSKSGNWAVTVNFDQYLYMPEPASGPEETAVHTAAFELEPEGIGVFFRFGYAPEDRNPWSLFVSGGVGGRGVIPSRHLDRYGLGFYAMIESDDLRDQPVLGGALGTEWGMEAFYNLAITPWLQFTPSIQYVQSGLPRIDDSVVIATRLQLYF